MFTADTFRFLEDLTEHNERPWFEANRARYETTCREPALALIRAMVPVLATLAPHFVADDRKVGGSLMRLHRDTRFGADKRPYKTNLGIQFRHDGGADVHAPSVYLHVAAGGCFLGIGSWMPEPPILERLRRAIVDDPAAWRAAMAPLAGWDTSGTGEGLKRAPKGFDPAHPLVEELKKKSHLVMRPLPREEVVGPGLDGRVADHLEVALPWLRWLTEASGAAF
jgi:uncharacterized protein (TIGR02453 family)